MDRRSFLLSAAAFALPIPPGDAIGFKVLRNGSPIGEHHLAFSRSGDALDVSINVALLVKFAGITLFRYALQASETWSGGVFQSLESVIDDNGTRLEVQAQKTAAGYLVNGINHSNPADSYPQYTAPANTLPLTYWNKKMLDGTILNIQTAHSYPAVVNSPGWNNLPTAEGGVILAQRFDVTGKLNLSVWYDQNNQWSGLEFHINGDESYQKITT
jgi:hypothetical protein